MDLDMDIDMDLGIEPVYDEMVHETPTAPGVEVHPSFIEDSSATRPLDSDANEPVPNKVHLRGLDNLTSSDIRTFASNYYPDQPFEKIEWINDTSANLVYETPEHALKALTAFADAEVDHEPQASYLQTFTAKKFLTHPDIRLQVRLAVSGDRKQAGARERSRFYLFNPEHDRGERRKRESDGHDHGRHGRRYRDRDDATHRGRGDGDAFDASLYDDDEVTRAVRASAGHSRQNSRSSISSGEYRGQRIRKMRYSSGAGKELFPDRMINRRRGGTLRDRSASPSRDGDGNRIEKSLRLEQSNSTHQRTKRNNSANRIQAKLIKTMLKESNTGPRELFPEKSSSNHRRSDAFDAADATADLFASKMSAPLMDGAGDNSPRRKDPKSKIEKTRPKELISSADTGSRNAFNIRGTAEQHQNVGISIKGTAVSSAAPVKELFPSKVGLNSGKELFAEKLEGRGGRRQRAEDMFY